MEGDLGPSHIVIGPTRRRRRCDGCTARQLVDAEQEEDEYVRASFRAKAVLEYFRGERPSPLTDEQLQAIDQPQQPGEIPNWLIRRDPNNPLVMPYIFPGDEPENRMRGLDNREVPASFLEWTSANTKSTREGDGSFLFLEQLLCGDINSYLQYLQGFEDRSYHSKFSTALARVVAEEYTSVQFDDTLGTSNLLSFFTFVRKITPPILDDFGSMKLATSHYEAYLRHQRQNELIEPFQKGRIFLLQRTRDVLNNLTATGEICIGGNPLKPLTFGQWTRSKNNSPDPTLTAVAQLWLDVYMYEQLYLAQSSNLGMIQDFRAMRANILAHNCVDFSFHPHTEDLKSFCEYTTYSPKGELEWYKAMEQYLAYLRESGHSALEEKFEVVRQEHARADRRQLEGLSRVHPESTPGTFLNPTSKSEADLDIEFRRTYSKLTTRLIEGIYWRSATGSRPEYVAALRDIGGLVHDHRKAGLENRPRTLEEWERIHQKFAGIEKLIPQPPREIFLPYPPELEQECWDSLVSSFMSLRSTLEDLHASLVEQMNNGDDSQLGANLNPIRQGLEAFVAAGDESSSSADNDYDIIASDPQAPTAENGGQTTVSAPEDSDYIVHQLQRWNQAHQERVRERRRREQNNERPLTPDMEDGMSEMDEDEAADILLEMFQRMGFDVDLSRD